jgi:hypothetical protein
VLQRHLVCKDAQALRYVPVRHELLKVFLPVSGRIRIGVGNDHDAISNRCALMRLQMHVHIRFEIHPIDRDDNRAAKTLQSVRVLMQNTFSGDDGNLERLERLGNPFHEQRAIAEQQRGACHVEVAADFMQHRRSEIQAETGTQMVFLVGGGPGTSVVDRTTTRCSGRTQAVRLGEWVLTITCTRPSG